ncbi:hypothetical protein QKT49_gp374 [Acanthamoeba castellanii medusavirus]|uniref:Uncharacterized protein n=1 Tax=Acanthamoeba castellanii medusavirus J1 TaxID=3114988 RepID=A0A3T1CX51_9VIRU|nr:hypothetical protein QKT49_gp374 [Acanthamoeba castellanii medusavirus]BBI30389.1 hypothetical protein [Acanthamoeba castellanii medusavirus J1]
MVEYNNVALSVIAAVVVFIAVYLLLERKNGKPTAMVLGGKRRDDRRYNARPPSYHQATPTYHTGSYADGSLTQALAGTGVRPDGWRKVGLLMPATPGKLPLQLFERFTDRRRNEYMVELDDEVAVPLDTRRYYDLNDDDEVIVPSRENDGPFKVQIYESDALRYRPYVY